VVKGQRIIARFDDERSRSFRIGPTRATGLFLSGGIRVSSGNLPNHESTREHRSSRADLLASQGEDALSATTNDKKVAIVTGVGPGATCSDWTLSSEGIGKLAAKGSMDMARMPSVPWRRARCVG